MAKKNKKNGYLFFGGVILILGLMYLIFFTSPQAQLKEVKLYFSYNQAQNLKAEVREVKTDKLYKNTIRELIKGPSKEDLGRTIPEGTELINLELEEDILTLNFNSNFRKNHWGGSTGEIMTIYSIVNTMCQFSEVDQVLFLLEGEQVESLVGHVSLNEPVSSNNKLIK